MAVFAATVKLANFYHQAPSFWFVQAESQFSVKGITVESTKFHHVVSVLPQEIALRVMPAVESLDYQMLKTALLEAYDLTETQRATKLLHLQGLGDKLPSVLTSEIIALVPSGKSPDYLERQIFLEQLPAAVQQNMAAHETERDLWKLAKIPDGYVIATCEF